MKVTKVEFDHLGALVDLKLVFPTVTNKHFGNLNVTVIVGENGTGKTSLLRFLAYVFYAEYYEHYLPQKFKIQYELDNKKYELTHVMKEADKKPPKVIVSTYSPFEQYDPVGPSNFEKEYSYIGARSRSRYGSISTLSASYLPILSSLYRSDNNDKAIQALLNEIGYTDPPLIELNSVKIQYSASQRKSFPGMAKVIDRLNAFHEKGKYIESEKLVSYPGGAEGWLQDVRKTMKSLNKNLIKTLWFTKGDSWISMSDLSSGELSMFYRFFRLIDAMSDGALVLIDEPEINLHPRWIQKYTHMLKEVFGHYHAHFILATHSTLIASDVPNESIIGLRFNRKSKQVEQYFVKGQTLGSSQNEILREVFGIENYIGGLTNDIIEKVKKLIKESKIDEAYSLFDDLGDSDEKFSLFMDLEQIDTREE